MNRLARRRSFVLKCSSLGQRLLSFELGVARTSPLHCSVVRVLSVGPLAQRLERPLPQHASLLALSFYFGDQVSQLILLSVIVVKSRLDLLLLFHVID